MSRMLVPVSVAVTLAVMAGAADQARAQVAKTLVPSLEHIAKHGAEHVVRHGAIYGLEFLRKRQADTKAPRESAPDVDSLSANRP